MHGLSFKPLSIVADSWWYLDVYTKTTHYKTARKFCKNAVVKKRLKWLFPIGNHDEKG